MRFLVRNSRATDPTVFTMRLPSSYTSGSSVNRLFRSTISATSRVIAAPSSIAIPRSASPTRNPETPLLNGGHVVHAVPDHRGMQSPRTQRRHDPHLLLRLQAREHRSARHGALECRVVKRLELAARDDPVR